MSEVELELEDEEELIDARRSSGGGSESDCSAGWLGVAAPSHARSSHSSRSGSGKGANLICLAGKSLEEAEDSEEMIRSRGG